MSDEGNEREEMARCGLVKPIIWWPAKRALTNVIPQKALGAQVDPARVFVTLGC